MKQATPTERDSIRQMPVVDAAISWWLDKDNPAHLEALDQSIRDYYARASMDYDYAKGWVPS